MRPVIVGLMAAVALVVAACGGDTTSDRALADVLGIPKDRDEVVTPEVLVPAGQEFVAGAPIRIPLGLLRKDGTHFKPDSEQIDVYLASSNLSIPIGPFPATYVPIEAPGVELAPEDIQGIWVAQVTVDVPGSYFIAATYTLDGARSSASGGIVLTDAPTTPPIGAKAPPSQSPTIESVDGDVSRLTTANPPDRTLLEHSIADSITAGTPFVVAFATPLYCTSRLCGPTVKIVEEVQRRLADTPMRFIHVEIFADNDPAKGPNAWVREWGLPSEPWVFVVGADGTVRAKFEGAVGVDELELAARAAVS